MKICALICSHSEPIFTKLTIASLLDKVGKNHEVSVHVGIHSNYSDYTSDYSLMKEYEKLCQFHVIDEIDWNAHNSDVYRYSKMHAKNMENLFKSIKFYDFDCVLILDNDLYIKEDFVTKFWNGEDIVSSMFNDTDKINTVIDEYGFTVDFMPKLSVWNLILSRSAYDKIMENLEDIRPEIVNRDDYSFYGLEQNNSLNRFVVFDTFAKVYFYGKGEWNFDIKIYTTDEMGNAVKHFFGSSFNYGSRIRDENSRNTIKEEVTSIYNTEYPLGSNTFLKDI